MRKEKILLIIVLIVAVMICLCGCAKKDDLSDLKFAEDAPETVVTDAPSEEEAQVEQKPELSDEELFDFIIGEWRYDALTDYYVGKIMEDPDGNRLYIIDVTEEFTKDGAGYRNYYGARSPASDVSEAEYVKHEDLYTSIRVENGKIVYDWCDEDGKALGTSAHDVEIIDHDHMNNTYKSKYTASGFSTINYSRK